MLTVCQDQKFGRDRDQGPGQGLVRFRDQSSKPKMSRDVFGLRALLSSSCRGLPSLDGRTGGRTDGQTDEQTEGQRYRLTAVSHFDWIPTPT